LRVAFDIIGWFLQFGFGFEPQLSRLFFHFVLLGMISRPDQKIGARFEPTTSRLAATTNRNEKGGHFGSQLHRHALEPCGRGVRESESAARQKMHADRRFHDLLKCMHLE